jgi:hypothetical protein
MGGNGTPDRGKGRPLSATQDGLKLSPNQKAITTYTAIFIKAV